MRRIWRAVCLLTRPHEILFMRYELRVMGHGLYIWTKYGVGLGAWLIVTKHGLDSTPLAGRQGQTTRHAHMK